MTNIKDVVVSLLVGLIVTTYVIIVCLVTPNEPRTDWEDER